MTIHEAIKHAEEQSIKLGNCDCAKEHKQLADWLRELLCLRETISRISTEEKSTLNGSVVGSIPTERANAPIA